MTNLVEQHIIHLQQRRAELHDDIAELDDVIANAPMLQSKVMARALRNKAEEEIRRIESQLKTLRGLK